MNNEQKQCLIPLDEVGYMDHTMPFGTVKKRSNNGK